MALHIGRFSSLTAVMCALHLVGAAWPSAQGVTPHAESGKSAAQYDTAQVHATAATSAPSTVLGHEQPDLRFPRAIARRSESDNDNADPKRQQAESRRPAQQNGTPNQQTPPNPSPQQPRADQYRQLTNEAAALLRAQDAATAARAAAVRSAGAADRKLYSAILSQHNTLRKAVQAFGDSPRRLGAFRRLVTISNGYEALLAEAKRHTARGRLVPGNLQLRLDEARWALAARGKFARAIAQKLGALPPVADAAAQRQQGLDLERVMAELEQAPPVTRGREDAVKDAAMQAPKAASVAEAEAGRSLREIGEQMLAAEKARRAPAAQWPTSSLQDVEGGMVAERGPEPRLVPWERAADVLAAEAAALERETGKTWLLQGESQEAVSVGHFP